MKKIILLIGFLIVVGLTIGCSQQQNNIGQAVPNSSFVINPSSAEVLVGGTQQFTIEGLITTSSTAEISNVCWTVLGWVGAIDANGLFTASASGEGSVVATIGGISGEARVVVTTRTISGRVLDGYNDNAPISGAVVIAGDKSALSGSDGNFIIRDVSPEVSIIHACKDNYSNTTLVAKNKCNEATLLEYLVPNYQNEQRKNVLLKGHLLNYKGDSLESPESFKMMTGLCFDFTENITYDAAGGFYISVDSCNLNIIGNERGGFLCVMHRLNDGSYKSATKEFSYNFNQDVIDLGDITVDKDIFIVSGDINLPSLNNIYLNYLAFGKLMKGFYLTIAPSISSDNNKNIAGDGYFGEVHGSKYTLRLPQDLIGKNYFVCSSATASNSSSYDGFDYQSFYKNRLINELEKTSDMNYKFDVSFINGPTLEAPRKNEFYPVLTPKIEWDAANSNANYFVGVEGYITTPTSSWSMIIWSGITDKTEISYPFFEGAGSNGNLTSGEGYALFLYSFVNEGKDISKFKLEDLLVSSDSTYRFFEKFYVNGSDISSLNANEKNNGENKRTNCIWDVLSKNRGRQRL